MNTPGEVEILLVEDNPDDVEMTLRALRKANIVNRIKTVRDGAEALAFLFGEGAHTADGVLSPPKLILLDLECEGGHGQGGTKAQRQRQIANYYAFMLWQAGRSLSRT